METENAFLSDLHFEHKAWINELKFFEDEILTFERRLEEMAKRHLPKQEVMVELEHYQNQFIRQKEVINDLKHDIRMHEQYLTKKVGANPDSFDQPEFTDHVHLRERMEVFRRIYDDLKSEFYRYAARWI